MIEIKLGDCLKIIPNIIENINFIIIDPPYGTKSTTKLQKIEIIVN